LGQFFTNSSGHPGQESRVKQETGLQRSENGNVSLMPFGMDALIYSGWTVNVSIMPFGMDALIYSGWNGNGSLMSFGMDTLIYSG
jgi:hypothetical protein